MTAVQASLWHGPLPPPDALAAFNDVIPNGAERIFAEWEGETAHRRKIEMISAGLEVAERLGSRILAALFVFAALGASVFLGYEGHDWLAGTMATTTIGTVLGTFLYSKSKNLK